MNLAGGGLQSANLWLAQFRARCHIAYGLPLFPFGAHRAYLEDRRGALLYLAGLAATVLCLIGGRRPWVGHSLRCSWDGSCSTPRGLERRSCASTSGLAWRST